MASPTLLLMSSSRAGNSAYLEPYIESITALCQQRKILFIPYAGVGMSNADYTARVQAALAPAGLTVEGIETSADPIAAIKSAEAILVGGGNTFNLLYTLYQQQLLDPIRQAVASGTPYLGWSAGSNIAGLSIRTTNDMPIVQPPSFTALAAVPFQINPHYTNATPAGHRGETRDERIMEFMQLNPATSILGIPEGTALSVAGAEMQLLGKIDGVVFRDGRKLPLKAGKPCSEWL